MNDFETQLRKHIEADPHATAQSEGILKILHEHAGPRKQRRIDRMERRVRSELGLTDTAQIDWASIDWATLLPLIMKIVLTLLPLIFATEKKED